MTCERTTGSLENPLPRKFTRWNISPVSLMSPSISVTLACMVCSPRSLLEDHSERREVRASVTQAPLSITSQFMPSGLGCTWSMHGGSCRRTSKHQPGQSWPCLRLRMRATTACVPWYVGGPAIMTGLK